MNRRLKIISALVLLALLILAASAIGRYYVTPVSPIKVGVLHSLTGTMAVSEKPLVDAVRLATEEINAQGGLLGQTVEMVVADGKSDPKVFAAEAERLIQKEQVKVLFGCWTSACRKAVKPVVEKYRHLLFYPVQYEGMEQSDNILYTGSAPNQQIVPGTRWATQTFGLRVYLVGSDYIFPRTANIIIGDLIRASGGTILGERYLPLAGTDTEAIIQDIVREKPDVVLNTLNGDSNAAFFAALVKAGLSDLPLVSFSVEESGMRAWNGGQLTRHYGVWNYFQSLPGEGNHQFVSAYKARFGADRVVSAPVEAAYVGVNLWTQAVRTVNSSEPGRVNPALLRQSIKSPSGIAAVDADSRHLWMMMRVGKVAADGQFEQVFASSVPLRPSPWPNYRSRDSWQALLLRGRP
ncbi:urea ABC transporter substrate-binding protein [Candidatus Methylobacter oryzae]|uniref:ABC transporter substrate-binding protein n=1 Tax=Candidatus Methylobacter oryzae TaxID=2497749 RepID=A0ABY3C5Y0_9GAMM|nr:urea ABC transporter substrate-binding protein [Candidatus Methylobacter oryzae]TRW89705.1 ABC transporter substrate-binding protein [Candidatus Methylobacter oryzae]